VIHAILEFIARANHASMKVGISLVEPWVSTIHLFKIALSNHPRESRLREAKLARTLSRAIHIAPALRKKMLALFSICEDFARVHLAAVVGISMQRGNTGLFLFS
jgi:hypothetical protein